MAKVTQPLGSSEARGRVGGFVYQPWRGLHTVRARVGPAYIPNSGRDLITSTMAQTSQEWRQLTQAQRDAWNQWADQHPDIYWTGEPLRLCGYHWYCRLNFRRNWVGAYSEPLPPEIPFPHAINHLAQEDETGDIKLTWTWWNKTGVTAGLVDIWHVGPHSPGRNMTIKDASHDDFAIIDDTPLMTGIPASGAHTFFARVLDTHGRASPFLKSSYNYG